MKKVSFLIGLLLTLAIVSCKDEKKSQEARIPEQYAIEDLYNTKYISASGFNADETKIIIDNNATGIVNTNELTLSDTTTIALTKSTKESIYSIDYLPGSPNFIYAADEGGNRAV